MSQHDGENAVSRVGFSAWAVDYARQLATGVGIGPHKV